MELDKKLILPGVGGLVVLAAAGWFGWQYFEDSTPAPQVAKPIARPAAARKVTAPPRAAAASRPAKAVQAPAAPKSATAAAAPEPSASTQSLASTASSASKEAFASTKVVEAAVAGERTRPSATRAPSRASEDARICLKLVTNAEVHKCAEEYR